MGAEKWALYAALKYTFTLLDTSYYIISLLYLPNTDQVHMQYPSSLPITKDSFRISQIYSMFPSSLGTKQYKVTMSTSEAKASIQVSLRLQLTYSYSWFTLVEAQKQAPSF